ncbi:hypothetical protein [Sediminibacterium sp. C3]|uniref:hypothetical protein n=1 Tax=Sediminibacterium sp. C3 TaxID=1267211 RepID=UPI000409E5D5|nr:hypothetical protein [Sediminibacterium sp. C3]
MIHFFLNIEKFYEAEFEKGFEVQAVACIEYPIIHVIARTLETMEEEYDELDKFIVQAANIHDGFSIQQFSELTGLSEGVFRYRAEELVKQEYISFQNQIIKPIAKGFDFLNKPYFEREIEKTRSFILDGVTHEPLKSYFYKEGKENLISEDERDSWGNKIFKPAIIHNPPTKNLTELILKIPIDERINYSIPTHLKEIKDYDFILMTYPLPIVLSKTKDGKTCKKLIDGFTKSENEENIAFWQKKLKDEIAKTEVIVDEKDIERDGVKSKTIRFKSNWGNTRSAIDGRIYNITKVNLIYFIQKLYGLATINENNIFLDENEIRIKVDKKFFESDGADKIKILEACVRGRDYYRQYQGIGIWLVFIKVVIADKYIHELIELRKLLEVEKSIVNLILHYKKNFKSLRQNLIAIERLDILEKLDIHLFLHSRETNFNQNYLTLQNE